MATKQRLFIALAIVVAVGAMAILFFFTDFKSEKNRLQSLESARLNVVGNTLGHHFEMVVSDLLILPELHEFERLFGGDKNSAHDLADNFLTFARAKKVYDQIRYIDNTGMEIVRVNYRNGEPFIVTENMLQDKSRRYYYTETIKLGRGEIYVSAFDLNIENGKVERPIKPVIRFGAPVYDGSGVKRGVILINYLGKALIDAINISVGKSEGSLMLLNSDGYWLRSPNPEDEWGFMFEDKKEVTFGASYPDEWKKITTSSLGQFETSRGLFTFKTLFPVLNAMKGAHSSHNFTIGDKAHKLSTYNWKIISIINPETISARSRMLFIRLGILYLTLVVLLLAGSVIVDRSYGKSVTDPAGRLSPLTLLVTTSIVIFFAELIVMFSLPMFQPMAPMMESFVDALMLFILSAPTLYFLLFRPLVLHIKERETAEAEREQVMADLERINIELNEFAYVVSHDLKAPLRAISSLAEWISQDYSDKIDQEGQENLALLVGRTKRMNSLISGILEYSRLGRSKQTSEPVDTGILVREVIEFLSPPENINITVAEHMPTLHYDATRLEQVFLNLIENAIKHMGKPDGIIDISCRGTENIWEFCVKDNGEGIEEKHFERIFKIFQSLKSRDQKESTGIGLALVKKIVERNGGEIWVKSIKGEGSEFYFTVPKATKVKQGESND